MKKETTGTVHGAVSIVNDMGGITTLPVGRYRVRVLEQFMGYMIGNDDCIGELLDSDDIQAARALGTTGYTRQAAADFHPERVYFLKDWFIPGECSR